MSSSSGAASGSQGALARAGVEDHRVGLHDDARAVVVPADGQGADVELLVQRPAGPRCIRALCGR